MAVSATSADSALYMSVDEDLEHIAGNLPMPYRRRLYWNGFQCFFDEWTIDSCGYAPDSPAYDCWVKGYSQAFRDFVRNQEKQRNKDGEVGKETTEQG